MRVTREARIVMTRFDCHLYLVSIASGMEDLASAAHLRYICDLLGRALEDKGQELCLGLLIDYIPARADCITT